MSVFSVGYSEDASLDGYVAPHPELRGLGQRSTEDIRAGFARYQTMADRSLALDPDRSLFVRKDARLVGLTFKRIMSKLADDTGTDAVGFFRQFWANLGYGESDQDTGSKECPGAGPAKSVFNDFPVTCSSYLYRLASLEDPFGEDLAPHFRVIAAVNRNDLQLDGDCGEYRLIAAADPGWLEAANFEYARELYIIFEWSLSDGGEPERCVAIQRYWARLSQMSADADIARALDRFYFEGGTLSAAGEMTEATDCSGVCFAVGPVVAAGNMTFSKTHKSRPGQIRVNANTIGPLWTLREYRFLQGAPSGLLRLVTVPVANSPDFSTFDDSSVYVTAIAKALLGQSGTLSGRRFAELAFVAPPQTYANQQSTTKVYFDPYFRDPKTTTVGRVMQLLEAAKHVSVRHLVNRVTLLSCMGCHRFSNVDDVNVLGFDDLPTWPGSLKFTHISVEGVVDGQYVISDALINAFLPRRKAVMEAVIGVELTTLPVK